MLCGLYTDGARAFHRMRDQCDIRGCGSMARYEKGSVTEGTKKLRLLWLTGKYAQIELARLYGVSSQTISQRLKGIPKPGDLDRRCPCGKSLPAERARYNAIYCCDSCSMQARNERRRGKLGVGICLECQAAFQRGAKNSKVCKRKCQNRYSTRAFYHKQHKDALYYANSHKSALIDIDTPLLLGVCQKCIEKAESKICHFCEVWQNAVAWES